MNNSNEFGNIAFDLPKNQSNVIKVIGVGGGGSNAINYMFQQGINGVDFVICNTDAQALQSSGVPNKIQLGVNLTEGLGAGANPTVGEEAAKESKEDILRMLNANAKMVFITAGMGGGTGTGAAPVIAKMAKKLDILTVGIVTMPFKFEGKMRNEQAQEGVEKLREHVDSLVVINNNKLREVYGNLGFKAGFSKADEVLATAAKGIAEVITHHYTQNIDLKDAKTVLSNSGTAIMGSATAKGESRAQDAIMKALDSPLLNDNKIKGAKNVLLLIVSGKKEITIDEIGEINDHIQTEAGFGANIIMGVGEDETLEEAIAVTIIATGFHVDQQDEMSNTETKKVVHSLNDDLEDKTDKAETIINKITEKPKIVKHLLLDDDTEDDQDDKSFKIDLIPTTEVIKNTNVVYEEVIDNTLVIEDNDFIITSVEQPKAVTQEEPEEQMALTFDLPLNFETPSFEEKTKSEEENAEPNTSITRFELDEDIRAIQVNEPIEIVPVVAVNEEDEKRYILEDIDDDNDNYDSPSRTKVQLDTKEDVVFEKKILPKTEEQPKVEIDPIHSPISEMLTARAGERKLKMKKYNHQFNTAKIDEIEKEPAYKRQGVDIEDTQHSSENIKASRLSVSTDDNDDTQLRSNNSFLHDNVD